MQCAHSSVFTRRIVAQPPSRGRDRDHVLVNGAQAELPIAGQQHNWDPQCAELHLKLRDLTHNWVAVTSANRAIWISASGGTTDVNAAWRTSRLSSAW